MQRTMPPACHATAGEAFAPSEAAEGCGSGGGGSSGGGVVEDRAVAMAVAPPKIDREEDPQAQQRADNGGEGEGTQCGVRANIGRPAGLPAAVTERQQQLQCGGGGGRADCDSGGGGNAAAAPSSTER